MKKLVSLLLVVACLVISLPAFQNAVKAEEVGNYKTVDDVSTFAVLNGAAIRLNKANKTFLRFRFAAKPSYIRNLSADYSGQDIYCGVALVKKSSVDELGLEYKASIVLNDGHAETFVCETSVSDLELDETGTAYLFNADSIVLEYDRLYEQYAALGYIRIAGETDLYINAPYNPEYNLRSAYEVAEAAYKDTDAGYGEKLQSNMRSFLERVAVLHTNGTQLTIDGSYLTLESGATLSSFKITGSTITSSNKIGIYVDGVYYDESKVPLVKETYSKGACDCSISSQWAPTEEKKSTISISPDRLETWSNFDKDLTLAIAVTGSTYSKSSARIYSTNPYVCDVDKNGKIEPHNPGVAYICVETPDGSSNRIEVSLVEPVERAENQQINLGSTTKARYDQATYLGWPNKSGYGSYTLAAWQNNAKGACSITIDDSITADFEAWNQATTASGIPVTFIAPGKFSTDSTHQTWWKAAIAAGNDVQSHSQTHQSSATYETWTTAQVWMDYWDSISSIENVTGKKVNVIGYSYGWGNETLSAELFIAGRGVYGTSNIGTKINYAMLNSVSCSWNTDFSFFQWVQALYDSSLKIYNTSWYGGWTSFHWHGVSGSAFTTSDGTQIKNKYDYLNYYFTKLLQPVKEQGLVYFDTFQNVAKYAQERDSATLTQTLLTENEIRFELTDLMDDTIFNMPITIKVQVDETWTGVKAVQNGQEMSAQIVKVEDGKSYDGTYVMFDMIPDVGELVLTAIK